MSVRALIMGMLALFGCGDERGMVDDAATDTGVVADSAMVEDTGTPWDPARVRWEMVEPPAAGPLMLWAGLIAQLDAKRSILFGGTTANTVSGTTLSETWLYDASGGTLEVTEISDGGPAPRYCGCAAFDPVRGRVVLTGGRNLTAPGAVPAETWELDVDGRSWNQVPVPESPPGVIGCMLAWSETRGAMYLFGGASAAGASDTTYRYDPDGPAWVALDATGPSGRYDGVFAPLGAGEEILLFGGSLSAMGAAFFSDVWRFDTAAESWTETVVDGAVPEGRRVPWIVFSPEQRGFYLSMGFDGRMQPIGDFHYFDLEAASWTTLSLPVDLGARAFTQAVPAPGEGLGSMLSGYDGEAPVRELWQLVPMP